MLRNPMQRLSFSDQLQGNLGGVDAGSGRGAPIDLYLLFVTFLP